MSLPDPEHDDAVDAWYGGSAMGLFLIVVSLLLAVAVVLR